ncbi:TonB-dependent receptor domain-containing protein [Prevotella sp. AGR2160]|uniref:TonB-dependent receptor domain-containing protein n=1 Tax=Prevotella sp. AGR2160 TaxID=1280674 RepID=UPI00048E0E2E|nr:TonB-dependent receptor [Prevotella sp. AGR2160]
MKRLILFSMMCLVAIVSAAQDISGRVIDEQAKPMPFANVVLVSRADSAFIAGTMTKDDGTFSISTDIQDGLLKVTSVGYTTKYLDARTGNVGDIQMQPDTKELGEVVVKGERPQYKMTAGGMTVDIQNSLLKDVGTADDVLSMLPQVQGGDGNFTVFAKGTPEIYINNKKVQNARELKRLKSTDIKSVDVITSPGAKYNAEVGAVIRIKTKKRQGDGISMEASSQVKYNEKWTTYDDATVKYRTGGLEVFGNMMINNDNHSEDNTITTDIRANGNHVNIIQVCPNNFWYTMLGGQIGSSYDFNDENSIGFSYTLSGALYGRGTAQTQQTITRNNAPEGMVDQFIEMNISDRPQHEANIYYVGKAGKLGIDFNGSWIWEKNMRDQASFEHSLQLADRTVTTHNENRNHMLAGKLVLTYPIWKGELSAGTEMSRSNSHGIYSNVEQVMAPSNDEIKESNVAGFTEYKLKLGDWSLNGGLRYETVTSDYYSFGQYQTEPSRKYHDLFPNLSVGWQKNKWGIQLGYNKRISRPNYQALNSNVQYDNRYEYEGGNPLLRPTIKQNIDLNVTYSWLNFTAGYGYNKDLRLNFGYLYQEGTEITIWTNRNFDKFESFNASLTASPKFGFYSPTLTLSYWQQNFDTQAYGLATKRNKPEWQINFRNWFTINKATKAMLYLHYSTSHDYGFNHYAHEFNINARVQKTFLDGNLTVALFANDIFRNLRERWTGYYPVSTTAKDAYVYTQSVGVSLTYNFNATNSKYKGTGAGNEEKKRL